MEVTMFDHVTLKVADFRKSLAFYRAVLAPLGFEEQYLDEAAKSVGFGPQGKPRLWLAEGKPRSSIHLAFESRDRDGVSRFYGRALESGGQDNGKPGLRADYGENYFAAFVFDPDGNNVEAVTFGK